MNRLAACLAACVAILLPLGSACAAAVQLAREGAPICTIVTAPQATRSAQLGALELQHHLGGIIGTAPAIVTDAKEIPSGSLPIYVGDGPAAAAQGLTSAGLKSQEQIIRITPKGVWLIGHDTPDTGPVTYEKTGTWPGLSVYSPDFQVGSLYAVYDFLERDCGVRWYMPGELGTVIPKNPSLAVEAADRRVMPWTSCRLIGTGSWAKPGTYGKLDSMGYERTEHWGNGRDNALYMLRNRTNGAAFSFNAHPFHSYHKLYGKTHPGWFVDSSPGPNVQLRYGKQEVVDAVTRNILDFFDGKTDVASPVEKLRFSGGIGQRFMIGPSDTRLFGKDAQPPLDPGRKRPGTFSDGIASNYWFTFVKKVAGRVQEKHPECWIGSSAYASHYEPPDFALPSNVGVYVCTTEGWGPGSYGIENLRAWKQKVNRLFVYEYWYSQGRLPAVRPHRLARYIALLRQIGVGGWNMEMISGSNATLYHLDYYLNMRLLYDPDAKIDELLAEYYQGFYGPAATPMKRFWETLESAYDQWYDNHDGRIELWAQVAKTDFHDKLVASLGEAEKLATADPYAARVHLIRTGVLESVENRMNEAVIQANTPIPELTVTHAPVRIALDGKLDDAAWQAAPTTSPFVHMNTVKPTTDDVGKVLWDGRNLYIGMVLIEPNMDTQSLIHKTSTSGICMDDSVEIFVDVNHRMPAKRDYLQVMLTADGVQWRYYWGKARVFAQDMEELGIQTAAWRGPDRWTAEVKIPLQAIVGLTDGAAMPKDGDVWGLGLYRNRRSEFKANVRDRYAKGATGWSPTFAGFHVAGRFGKLVFAQ